MKKLAIFNVGGALSMYLEHDDQRIIIDLGSGNGFSPVDDFLMPLFRRRGDGLYIDQLLLSHLDKDHISDFPKFCEKFHVNLITTPSDNQSMEERFKIKRDMLSDNEYVDQVLLVMGERIPGKDSNYPEPNDPLKVYDESYMSLFYLNSEECCYLDSISKKSNYANNLSLVLLLRINNYSILLPGDIMDDGMEKLLEKYPEFQNRMRDEGLDFLVAPHHGLNTSFPFSLFRAIKGNKTKLNIISEKKGEKEDSDHRSDIHFGYSNSDYSEGYKIINGLKSRANSILTSNRLGTHIIIDFDKVVPIVKRCPSEELLREFS